MSEEHMDPGRWGRTSGISWYVSLFIMFLVVLAVIAVVVLHWLGYGGPAASSTPATTVTASQQPAAAGTGSAPAPSGTSTAAACGDRGWKATPARVAPRTSWDPVDAELLPTTKQGPLVTTGTRSCFEHSPTGAVVALSNVLLQVCCTSPSRATSVLNRQVTVGQLREDALQAPGSSDPTQRFQLAGFKVLSASSSRVVVDVALASSGSEQQVMQSSQLSAVWSGSDWKMDGSQGTSPTQLDSLAGYVVWAPGGAS